MTSPDHGERDRAAFDELWDNDCGEGGIKRRCGDYFVEGAAHGRADAERDRDYWRERCDEARLDAGRLKLEHGACHRAAEVLASGAGIEYGADTYENRLHRALWILRGGSVGVCVPEPATPPPDSALRERVVEAAMGAWSHEGGHDGITAAIGGIWDACAALAAATPKPTDAVREAAGRRRDYVDSHNSQRVGDLRILSHNDLRAVLDALDSARGEGGG